MSSQRPVISSIQVLLLLLCVAMSASSDQPQGGGISGDTYDRVLELLFPREEILGDVKYRITLRYSPHPDPQYQLVITVGRDDRVEVTSFALEGGVSTLWERLDEAYARIGKEDPKTLARQIHVSVQRVDLDPDVARQLLERFDELAVSLHSITRASALLEESTYEIWCQGDSGKMHVRFYGPHPDHDAYAEPLAKWMNDVKRAIDASEGKPKATLHSR